MKTLSLSFSYLGKYPLMWDSCHSYSPPIFLNHFKETWYVRFLQFAAISAALIDGTVIGTGTVIVKGGPHSNKTGFSLLFDKFLMNTESF